MATKETMERLEDAILGIFAKRELKKDFLKDIEKIKDFFTNRKQLETPYTNLMMLIRGLEKYPEAWIQELIAFFERHEPEELDNFWTYL